MQTLDSDDDTTEENVNVTTNFYTAAVLEFNPLGNNILDVEERIEANLNDYIKWIYAAKEYNVDILVFPEATLNYNGNRQIIVD